ncbi:MAG: hypothetical protein M3295_07895 [Chloroflexota bacterium]|nr:hypothetical protein [Chloroflexota bacterium]
MTGVSGSSTTTARGQPSATAQVTGWWWKFNRSSGWLEREDVGLEVVDGTVLAS